MVGLVLLEINGGRVLFKYWCLQMYFFIISYFFLISFFVANSIAY